MGKSDREIIAILKDVFQLNFVKPMKSDHNLRIWMIRMTFAVSVLGLLGRGFLALTGHDITQDFSSMVNTPIAFFFTLLFLHINNEIEDTSIIMFVLTWLSLMLALYV
ncbi:hypothetical protein ACXHRA_17150 [Vibrio antiquarius]|uniref:hypothetical protein n=1 Tax=Vibrio diabolicus TaxID=50719 RepID=UPI0011126373|nr:hypothetical protein [Vibrio diabolicus]TNC03541.1 hypothetical protein FHG74_22715 [Vibrio diabolicus]